MKKIFEIGIIAGANGLKGEVKIFPCSGVARNLIEQKYFIANGKHFAVEYSRLQGKYIVSKFEGVDDRDKAERLKGTVLGIKRENAAPLADGEYYMEDLIGCIVYEEGRKLGTVGDILETGGNDVYSVIDDAGVEILVPAIKQVVLSIDIDGRMIEVRLPEGLTDDDYI
ncbi:MAG: 16S rRNA processing protein RimM [Clostridia bacterium]|nr:16S rRNA processing protein RimM [Clostridia bacterium]